MTEYIKLAEAPTLSISNPSCGACCVEVESDGDGYTCPCCGTEWSYDAGEDRPGTLYEEWAGEDLDGDTVPNDEAWRHGSKVEKARREKLFAGLGIKF